MEPGPHPDPFAEALTSGSQTVAQIASLVAATSQVLVQQLAIHHARRTINDEQALRVLTEQDRQLRQQTRMAWAPANDRKWLAAADLLQVARAWAAAAAHSDDDPVAITAMSRCEDRLRVLHPYAMAYYDLLRGDGVGPLDAMRGAAPLFSRPAHVRVGDPVPDRHALTPATPDQMPSAQAGEGPSVERGEIHDDAVERAEYRARQIAQQLQERAREHDRPALGRDELTIVLETITNLPYPVIETIASGAETAQRPSAEAAQLAAESFPRGVSDAVRAHRTTPVAQPGRRVTLPTTVTFSHRAPGI
jgi:hypothetical protein